MGKARAMLFWRTGLCLLFVCLVASTSLAAAQDELIRVGLLVGESASRIEAAGPHRIVCGGEVIKEVDDSVRWQVEVVRTHSEAAATEAQYMFAGHSAGGNDSWLLENFDPEDPLKDEARVEKEGDSYYLYAENGKSKEVGMVNKIDWSGQSLVLFRDDYTGALPEFWVKVIVKGNKVVEVHQSGKPPWPPTVGGLPTEVRIAGAGEELTLPAPVRFELVGEASNDHYLKTKYRKYRGTLEVLIGKDGRLTVVNELPIEKYLYGVVPRELGPQHPLEALKAQAVAARTFAYSHLGNRARLGFDVFDTVSDQVYGGLSAEHPRTNKAVDETRGEVIRYDGKLISSFYSSTAADHTASIEESWPGADPQPYLTGVPNLWSGDIRRGPERSDEYLTSLYLKPNESAVEHGTPHYRWLVVWSKDELEEILSTYLPTEVGGLPDDFDIGSLYDIRVVDRGPSGRIGTVVIESSSGTYRVHQDRVRWVFRYRDASGQENVLRSSLVAFKVWKDVYGIPLAVTAYGGGFGHGIGMSQWGASKMAEAGKTYKEILTHYYRGVTVGK